MRSIIAQIGEEFPRLRMGIGRPPGAMDPAAYVLQDFDPAEAELVEAMIAAALPAIETFLSDGVDLAMTRHNRSGEPL
jgi:PTH1 family peptidyl-tRNA hydrolase